jgi:uncharacterized protein YbaR (Trm112 family)
MKPWLLNSLACPIDKHHPLEAHFFEWSTTEKEMEKISKKAGKINKDFRKDYKQLVNQIKDNTISFPSIRVITDYTKSPHMDALLNMALEAGNKLKGQKTLSKEQILKNFLKEIDVLYRFFNLIDVREGLLVCEECGGWYPVGRAVDGIPELLPDDLRDKEEELEWLLKWEKKIPLNFSSKH